MIHYRGIEIRKENGFYVTKGVKGSINKELKFLINQRDSGEYVKAIEYIIEYILESNPVIKSDQTIAYFSWVLKFIDTHDDCFSLWEAEATGNGYQEGIDYAIKVVREQNDECIKYGVSPIFPAFSQNIVVSKGVYEGLAIEAVRYQSPNHMTGWWLTTDLYDDNVDSLMNVHYYHVAFKRPDILKYFALPYGYRFLVNNKEGDVWFDADVLD